LIYKFDASPDNGMREKLGVILSGGGSKGAFQVGVLEYIAEHHDIAWISGTSVGAINGASFASGNSIDNLKKSWLSLDHKQIFPKTPGFFSRGNQEALKEVIRENIHKKRIEDCKVPLMIVTKNILARREHVFYKGDLLMTTLASSALKYVFPPVILDGIPHEDNIIVSDDALDCDRIVLVDILHNRVQMRHPLKFFLNYELKKAMDIKNEELKKKKAVVTIALDRDQNMFDFSNTNSLIKKGYDFTKKKL